MLKKTVALLTALSILVSGIMCSVYATSFSDTKGHWAESVIDKWSKKGVILGFDGKFRPDEFIIRGDMAIILCRVNNYDTLNENTFFDLSMSDYYADEILKLNNQGVILGADGLVRPIDNITREEAFVMINRIYKFEGTDAPQFDDADSVSDWARADVFALCENGIVNGSDGKINPGANITRAEVVQLLENISKPRVSIDSSFTVGEDDIWAGEIK